MDEYMEKQIDALNFRNSDYMFGTIHEIEEYLRIEDYDSVFRVLYISDEEFFSKATAKAVLEKMCEIPHDSNWTEEPIIACGYEQGENLIIARMFPVVMALHLKEYQMAEKLIDLGYPVRSDIYMNIYISFGNKLWTNVVREINCYHIIAKDLNVPDSLAGKLDMLEHRNIGLPEYTIDKIFTNSVFINQGRPKANTFGDFLRRCPRFEKKVTKTNEFYKVEIKDKYSIELNRQSILHFINDEKKLLYTLKKMHTYEKHESTLSMRLPDQCFFNYIETRMKILKKLKSNREACRIMAEIIIYEMFSTKSTLCEVETSMFITDIEREQVGKLIKICDSYVDADFYTQLLEWVWKKVKTNTTMMDFIVILSKKCGRRIPIIPRYNSLSSIFLLENSVDDNTCVSRFFDAIDISWELTDKGRIITNRVRTLLEGILEDQIRFGNEETIISAFRAGLVDNALINWGMQLAFEINKQETIPALVAGLT